ncbi:MAG: amidase [Dehalococcoidia bacterium]
MTATFNVNETTIDAIHAAFAAGDLTARQLTEIYLRRIEAYDKAGPALNAIITINPAALDDADRLDAAYAAGGLVGPLHGVPVILKDQMDAVGTPTTLGSVIFKDYFPDRDATVTAKLRAAGAIVLAKATLGELGGGDTHGTLFGSTRNPYDLERTAGGSSGGPGAAVSANLGAIAVGQEGYASIRRPSGWNCVVGMRPTAGVVSRAGTWGGGPGRAGSLGPMCRTVTDLAKLLDVMAGYDAEDPVTALGVGKLPATFTASLDAGALRGARVGIIREVMARNSEPDSEDFAQVNTVFDRAVDELRAAGAVIVDPVAIPDMTELLAKRAGDGSSAEFDEWMFRSANPPFKSQAEMQAHPVYAQVMQRRGSNMRSPGPEAHYAYLLARDKLMLNLMTLMADLQLDAIVHKTVEHTATLIADGVNPPYVNMKGAPHLNTFLMDIPSLSVPGGFTASGMPVGITLLGRPFSDPAMVGYAFAYEQATHHRVPPACAPALC